jgi:hypothetical protein
MKKSIYQLFFLATIFLVFTFPSNANPIGSWHGIIKVQGTTLRLVIHVEKSGDTYSSKFDSPDQNAYDIPFEQTTFLNNKLTCVKRTAQIEYSAVLRNDTLDGVWKQGNMSIPILMTQTENKVEAIEKKEVNRPQEPKGKLKYALGKCNFL